MRVYLLVALVAAAVTYLLSGLARRLAFRFNAVAKVRDRDVHTRPVPYFGGVSMWFGLAAAFLVATKLPWLGGFPGVSWDYIAPELRERFADIVPQTIPTFPNGPWEPALNDGWYRNVAPNVDRNS